MSNAEQAAVACAILGQAACIAYIGSKCFQVDFKISFAIIMCISIWNRIGITIAAACIVHQLFKMMQEKKETGHVLGVPAANPVAAAADAAAADAAAVDSRAEEVKKEEEREDEQTDLLCKESSNSTDEKELKNTEEPNCATKVADTACTSGNEQNTSKKKKIQNSVARIVQRRTREARVRNLSDRQQQQQCHNENRKQPLQSQMDHPGLHAFHQWMGAISGIYRMYSIGKVDEDESTIPLLPRSERGHVPLQMKVENQTATDIDVFWIDFKGNEVPKGSMKKINGNINITTWIGHPWAFRSKDSGRLMLYYVPYRIIPVIDAQKDNLNEDGDTGLHSFSIVTTKNIQDMCAVEDDSFPYPANSITNINKALEFSIQQMEREKISPHMILKYLYNIALHPSDSKYRQIRVANKVFWNSIWCNGGRGVLHALGFEEHGPYIEMGPDSSYLPGGRVKDVSNAIVMLEEFMKDIEDVNKPLVHQPRGADGSGTGRANWRM
jgi:hypothetical protein